MKELFIDGRIVYATSVQNGQVFIGKNEVRRLLSEKNGISVFALIRELVKVEVTPAAYTVLENLEGTAFFLEGKKVEDVRSYDELRSFDLTRSILRSIQGTLKRLVMAGQTVINFEVPLRLSSHYSKGRLIIKGIYLGQLEHPCIIISKKNATRTLEGALRCYGSEQEMFNLLHRLTEIVA